MLRQATPSCGTPGERRGGNRETGAERQQHRVLWQARLQSALQHEQCSGRRHVAEAPEDLALMVKAPGLEPERSFNRLDDLATAGMADETADIAALHGLGLQNFINGRPKAFISEGG